MELKGVIKIEESNYRKSLELAFIDYLEDEAQTPESFKEYMIDRLSEDFMTEIILDEERLIECFASGWLAVDGQAGKEYMQDLINLLPFFNILQILSATCRHRSVQESIHNVCTLYSLPIQDC